MGSQPADGGTVFPEGIPDLQALLDQASQVQQRIVDAQAQLAAARVTGSAGGGLVTATVSGTGELISLEISPEVCDPSDTDTLADLVVAAIRDASSAAARRADEQLGDLSGGLGTSMFDVDDARPGPTRPQLGFGPLPDPGGDG
jgi:DNA-binding YbaB/EbfC family protein